MASNSESLDSWLNLSPEERRKKWDELEVNVPQNNDPYPIKRKKLAVQIKEIDDLIKRGVWRHWRSWKAWDFMRRPITYCFDCKYPVRLNPTINQSTGALQKLECLNCGLIHYDSRYD